MHRVSRRCLLVLGLCCALVGFGPLQLEAQQCNCRNTEPFGICATNVLFDGAPSVIENNFYPDAFPGDATFFDRGGESAVLVADLFSGRAFAFQHVTVPIPVFSIVEGFSINSPGGSRTTSGVSFAVRNDLPRLYWAVQGNRDPQGNPMTWRIHRTDLNGDAAKLLGELDLAELGAHLTAILGEGNVRPSTLGGMTYHPGRDTFWLVDIVNDLYFEIEVLFEDTDVSEVNLAVNGGGNLVHFLNPLRHAQGGGAFGNTITAVEIDGTHFFDIPVGALSDGRPSQVLRVHADETETTAIGDETGNSYQLDGAVESPQFVTAIAYVPNSCSAGQHSEMLMDIDPNGGLTRLIEVSADVPAAASVVSLTCQSTTVSATLTWEQPALGYASIEISRREVTDPGSTLQPIFSVTAENDPLMFEDLNLLEGTYEYVIVASTGTKNLSPVSCRATVGTRGALVESAAFGTEGVIVDPTPYPVTRVGDSQVLVADLFTGDAEIYNADLSPATAFTNPFGVATGVTVGVADHPPSETIVWLTNVGGQHFLQQSDVAGIPRAGIVTLDTPLNLLRGSVLSGLAWDSERDVFWTVDLLNDSIYAIGLDGSVLDAVRNAQLANPESGGALGGGLAVADTAAASVTLDVTVRTSESLTVDQLVRVEYRLDTLDIVEEKFRLDLKSSLNVGGLAGLATVTLDNTEFAVLTATDTSSTYKVTLTSAGGVQLFQRGDVNNDNAVNIADPSFLLKHLFRSGDAPPCQAAGDVNDDAAIDISDAIALFNYLFRGGPAPDDPFPGCGLLSGGALACDGSICEG